MKIRKIFLKSVSAILATAMLLGAAVSVSAAKYPTVVEYDGRFSDVKESDWYYGVVTDAFSIGLINGKTDSTFEPDGELTLAEAVKLAAVSHQLLTKGKVENLGSGSVWYKPYLNYCKANYIVTEDYPNYDAKALRCQVAVLFSRAVTASGVETEELNEITDDVMIDVESSDWFAGAVYRMFRWGVMTGDENGEMHPNDTVKRSEIAAVVMRVIDPSLRVRLGDEPEPPKEEVENKVDKIVLYDGSDSSASFAGITGFAANFNKESGEWAQERSYSLNLIDNFILEPDNISFRLYKGSGYEALGIVRGWLNATARGEDGEEVRDADAVREKLNGLFYLWINGRRVEIQEMWYADHGDYVTYAFYFGRTANLKKVETVDVMCGRLGSDIMATDALSGIRRLLYGEDEDDTTEEKPNDTQTSDIYKITVEDLKSSAKEIIFEYECQRCAIIYGRGMYGGDEGEYRLLFVFRDGSTQTVYAQKLEDIRMNSDGNVLYYTVTAPDGELIQYGVSFKE